MSGFLEPTRANQFPGVLEASNSLCLCLCPSGSYVAQDLAKRWAKTKVSSQSTRSLYHSWGNKTDSVRKYTLIS